MPDVNWKHEIVEQLDFGWKHFFLDRMEGLTDAEYLWEPVAGWSVHPGDIDHGPTADWDWPAPEPAPFTTIAWRMFHITMFFTQRWMNHFSDREFRMDDVPIALTADDAMANIRAAYDRWHDAISAMPDERLNDPCGPSEGPYAEFPLATLLLHINREFHHHTAECCLLRDLYLRRDELVEY